MKISIVIAVVCCLAATSPLATAARVHRRRGTRNLDTASSGKGKGDCPVGKGKGGKNSEYPMRMRRLDSGKGKSSGKGGSGKGGPSPRVVSRTGCKSALATGRDDAILPLGEVGCTVFMPEDALSLVEESRGDGFEIEECNFFMGRRLDDNGAVRKLCQCIESVFVSKEPDCDDFCRCEAGVANPVANIDDTEDYCGCYCSECGCPKGNQCILENIPTLPDPERRLETEGELAPGLLPLYYNLAGIDGASDAADTDSDLLESNVNPTSCTRDNIEKLSGDEQVACQCLLDGGSDIDSCNAACGCDDGEAYPQTQGALPFCTCFCGCCPEEAAESD